MSDLQGQVNTQWGNCEEWVPQSLNIFTTTKNTQLLPTTHLVRGKVMFSVLYVFLFTGGFYPMMHWERQEGGPLLLTGRTTPERPVRKEATTPDQRVMGWGLPEGLTINYQPRMTDQEGAPLPQTRG